MDHCPSCQYKLKPGARCGQLFERGEDEGPITFSCGTCSRSYTAPRETLVQRIARGATRCQMCGGQLELPAELMADAEEEARPMLRISTACRCCGRTSAGEGKRSPFAIRCAFCGLEDTVDEQGRAQHTVADSPASVDEVAGWFAPLVQVPADRVVQGAMVARAALGLVSGDEGAALADTIARLQRWQPGGQPILPLPARDTREVLLHLCFRAELVSATDDALTLGYTTDKGKAFMTNLEAKDLARNVANNLIGIAFKGEVSYSRSTDEELNQSRRDVVIRLRPHGGDHVLVVTESLNQGRHEPYTQVQQLVSQLGAQRENMLTYYRRLAVFGPRARGKPAVAATEQALVAALHELGGHFLGHEANCAASLRLAHRPVEL
jgi:hypothetical protein